MDTKFIRKDFGKSKENTKSIKNNYSSFIGDYCD